METAQRRALEGAPLNTQPRLRQIERQLERFPSQHRAAVRAQAARYPAFADLALSFPALLFVIASRPRGIDVETLAHDTLQGAPLKQLAKRAKLPVWTRKLPPEAFVAPIGDLPEGDLVARRIANHLPRKAKFAASWLERVAFANRYGHEALALWVARNQRQLHTIETNWGQNSDTFIRRLCVWAWFSMADGTQGCRLIERRWTPGINPKSAEAAVCEWTANVKLWLSVYQIDDTWFTPAEVDGYAFVPLASSEEIRNEAIAMSNCLRSFGRKVAFNRARLWSMRKDGKRVATVCIGIDRCDRLLGVTEIRARANGTVSRQVAIAARKWCNAQDVFNLDPKPKDWDSCVKDRTHWQSLFHPYWIAKRTIPAWLPLTPDGGPF